MSRQHNHTRMALKIFLALMLVYPLSTAGGLARAAEQLHVFVRGAGDNALWKYWDSGQSRWTEWFSLDGKINASPAAVAYKGQIHLFVRGVDNNLYWKIWNGNRWAGWSRISDLLTAAPAAVSHNGFLYVFGVGGDKGLYVRRWDGSQWTGWSKVADAVNGQPAAASYGAYMFLYVRGMDGALYLRLWDGNQWNAWSKMGGSLSFGPAAAVYGGRLHLFAVGTDSGLYWRVWDGRVLSNWSKLGEASEAPAAAVHANATLHLLARGRDGNLYQRWYDGARWVDWQSLNGVSLSGPGATGYSNTTSVPPGGPNRAPVLARVDATRVTHAFGREESVRSEGVANRPGFSTLLSLTAPQVITLDPNRTGKPDPTSPIVTAAASIPSCCTLLVAEGAADPDGDPMVFRWQVPTTGTYYSTGSAGSAFPPGAKITDLSQYSRNSIIWEAPAIGFPVLRWNLMGGSTNIGVLVQDIPKSGTPLVSPTRFAGVEWDRFVHMELSFMSSRPLPAMDPNFPDGILMIYFVKLPNTFAQSTNVSFRVDCGSRKRVAGQSVFDQSITATGGRIRCPYLKEEIGAQVTATVVASTPGTAAGGNPFMFSLIPATMDLFRSRGCTLGDTITQQAKVTESTALTIDVWDSGNALDDAFDLLVDGRTMGRTQPGMDQIWDVSSLLPGEHELTVIYVFCQPCSGGGTFSVMLNGVNQRGPMTFLDASRVQSGNLPPLDGTQPGGRPDQRATFRFRIP